MKLKAFGIITPVTPITITEPGAPENEIGVPHITIIHNGNPVRTPYIKGNSIKGKLRRLAVESYLTKTVGKNSDKKYPYNVKISEDEYFKIAIGGVYNAEDKISDSYVSRINKIREEHPIISLFGSFAPMQIPSRIEVLPAIPSPDIDPKNIFYKAVSVRSDDFRINKDIINILDDESIERYYEDREEVAKNAKLKEKDKSRTLSIAHPDVKLTGITIGVPLYHRYNIINTSLKEIGLFISALKLWSENLRIGGYATKGHGYFNAEYKIIIEDDNDKENIINIEMKNPEIIKDEDGKIHINNEKFKISGDTKIIDNAIEAYEIHCKNTKEITP